MYDVIELRNEDIKKKLFDRIFWAAAGAMGEGGAVEIVTDDGEVYHCNYAYGDADIDLILEACPIISMEEIPEDYVLHYLGMGNCLVFRKEYEEKYNELLKEFLSKKGERVIEYNVWLDIASALCRKS